MSKNNIHNNCHSSALLLIGDELLCGQTQDKNLFFLGQELALRGLPLREVRTVGDNETDIIKAVNDLRTHYDYLFTTGGIGPTHDDITAQSIAKALNIPLHRNPEALSIIETIILPEKLNEARLSMANMPQGAKLVANNVSGIPGFYIHNIFVFAGVPKIMQSMFSAIDDILPRYKQIYSLSVTTYLLKEGDIASEIQKIQERFTKISIGSYPHYLHDKASVEIVLRSDDRNLLESAKNAVQSVIHHLESVI